MMDIGLFISICTGVYIAGFVMGRYPGMVTKLAKEAKNALVRLYRRVAGND